jgi:hypothetical protein
MWLISIAFQSSSEVLIAPMRNALRFRKLAHISILLLACWLTLSIFNAVDGSEFSGGKITGPIGTMCEVAIIGFFVGLVLAYPFPRVASVISLLASLLSLPILLYFIAPGPFRAVFRGEYSVPLQSNFVWSKWSLEPAIAVLIVVTFSVWNLFSDRDNAKRPSAA